MLYECRLLVPSTTLTWTLPDSSVLEFDILAKLGDMRDLDDNYIATLTDKMEDDDNNTNRFLFTSTLLILETTNDSTLTCSGAAVPDTVEESVTLTLSGECTVYYCSYISLFQVLHSNLSLFCPSGLQCSYYIYYL